MSSRKHNSDVKPDPSPPRPANSASDTARTLDLPHGIRPVGETVTSKPEPVSRDPVVTSSDPCELVVITSEPKPVVSNPPGLEPGQHNMFSMRHYRSLRDEEDPQITQEPTHINQGKSALYSCVEDRSISSPSSIITTTTTTPTTTKTTTSSSALSFQSIRTAWRNITSLGLGTSRLPHLERQEGIGTPPEPHDYRYTHFPNPSSKRPKETTFHHTHIHLTPATRTYTHPHRSPVPPPPLHHQHLQQQSIIQSSSEPLSITKCLKKHREKQARALTRKSKSDNALQKVGVNLKSHSDQNLHKVWLIGGTGTCSTTKSNSIFSNVQLSGGSGDSCRSTGSSGGSFRIHRHHLQQLQQQQQQRSRSLERHQGTKIYPIPSLTSHRHTRSLERNHKFRVDLRPLPPARDEPPDHLAPPPPIATPTHVPWSPESLEGSGGSASSSGGNSIINRNMEGQGRAGAFINKPARGWLHPDQQLAEDGICYGVRYIGCLEVNTPMKSLNFDTRSLIAKECISRVCESAGLKTADRKRKVVKTIGRILGERPLMDHAGSNVTLTITSTALTLTVLESGSVIATHIMPNISFASGGDPETLDFIAYVAKDNRYGRACFVLECGGGLAQDVITTIGQAFELRFKEYLKKTPTSVQYTNVKPESRSINGDTTAPRPGPEYYNDLPNKVPPDLPPPPVPPLPQSTTSTTITTDTRPPSTNVVPHNPSPTPVSVSPPPAASNPTSTTNIQPPNKGLANLIDLNHDEPEYVNGAVVNQIEQKDPFDMQPFVTQLPKFSSSVTSNIPNALPMNQRKQLESEPWFHKAIGRKEAELLLVQDGDFLVRESQGTPGQYVLTGMQNSTKKHLLLVDPEGVVRTKSQTFDSVSHLINYHRDNTLPIVSTESALVLRNAVICRSGR